METAILLRTLGRHLAAGHIPSPYQEAEKILAWFYGLSWNDFIIGLTAGSLPPLTKSQPRQLTNLAAKRSKHWPLAYLLGEKYFANRRFLMKAGVFIPRPDSERLLEIIQVDFKKAEPKPKTILDLGTGSGALIITLAKDLATAKPQPKFIAADISVPALTLARHNAKLHGTKINFIKSDLLNNLKSCPDWIIANLPYLAPADLSKKLIKTDSVLSLGFEPRRALFADSTDGLAAFKKLFSQIKKRGQCPQKLYLEFHPPHQAQLRKIIKQFFPKANIVTLADYSGQQRFLTINF